jgi:metal-dependent hydrolase (beta-lactamase superfamily II)
MAVEVFLQKKNEAHIYLQNPKNIYTNKRNLDFLLRHDHTGHCKGLGVVIGRSPNAFFAVQLSPITS